MQFGVLFSEILPPDPKNSNPVPVTERAQQQNIVQNEKGQWYPCFSPLIRIIKKRGEAPTIKTEIFYSGRFAPEDGLLFEAEAPGGDQEENQAHQQQETNLGQNLGEPCIFCHHAVVAFESMSVGSEF